MPRPVRISQTRARRRAMSQLSELQIIAMLPTGAVLIRCECGNVIDVESIRDLNLGLVTCDHIGGGGRP